MCDPVLDALAGDRPRPLAEVEFRKSRADQLALALRRHELELERQLDRRGHGRIGEALPERPDLVGGENTVHLVFLGGRLHHSNRRGINDVQANGEIEHLADHGQGAVGLDGRAPFHDAVEQQDHIAASDALGLPLAP